MAESLAGEQAIQQVTMLHFADGIQTVLGACASASRQHSEYSDLSCAELGGPVGPICKFCMMLRSGVSNSVCHASARLAWHCSTVKHHKQACSNHNFVPDPVKRKEVKRQEKKRKEEKRKVYAFQQS